MKLTYIHQYFTFPNTDGGTRSFDLATSFIKKGIEVVIITSSSNIPGEFVSGWNIIERDGLKLHVLKQVYSNSMSNLERINVFISFLVRSSFKLFTIEQDVVLATSTPLTIGIPALIN